MRLKLKFYLEKPFMPLDYRRNFLSFFKNIISSINNGEYFDRYFSGAFRRPYTFSVGLNKPVFEKDIIRLADNEINLIFSTGDTQTGYIFYSAFIAAKSKHKVFPMKNNSMKLVSIQKLNDFSTESDHILVKTLSPLCIREHTENGDIYYSSESKDFEQKLNDTIRQQLFFEGYSQKLADTISVQPVNTKKTVIYHYGQYCETTIGTFIVNGDKAVLNYLLKSGMGSRKSAGFGCIRLLSD